jgi:rod shape determining protein RodA
MNAVGTAAVAAPASVSTPGARTRRLVRNLDPVLIVTTAALVAFGLLMVYSTTRSTPHPFLYTRSQLLHLVIGVGVGIVLVVVDYRTLASSWRWLYAANLAMLLAVMVVGRTSLGAQRWIPLGPLGQFQPSEIAKLVIVITLAKHMADRPGPYRSIGDLVPFLGHVALPMFLIFRQPDLGTALVYGAIFAGMLYAGGARRRDLAALAASACLLF